MAVRAAVVIALLAGCIVGKRSLTMPGNDETTVALLSGGLGHPMEDVARHPWFAVRLKGELRWQIYEVGGGGEEDDPFHSHPPYIDPILHGLWRGGEGERAASCIAVVGPEVKAYIQSHYVFYPGPNSNTFGDVVLRRCKLSASLPATAIGKDWRGAFGAGITSERTGLQVETPIAGFRIGLKEGVEVHILGLSFGIDLWPPAIILPLGPGRIGFADR
jgi:uncharacterized protein DUF3750